MLASDHEHSPQFQAPLPKRPAPVPHSPCSSHPTGPPQSPFINQGSSIQKKCRFSIAPQTPVFVPITPTRPGSQSRVFETRNSPCKRFSLELKPFSFESPKPKSGRIPASEPRRRRSSFSNSPTFPQTERKAGRTSMDHLLLQTEPSFFEKNFDNLGLAGQGSFGRVYKVRHRETKEIFAIKKSCRRFSNHQARVRALKEVENYAVLGQKLDSHCVKYFQAWEDQQHLFIQTEFCSRGTLKQYLSYVKEPLSEARIWRFFLDIAMGVKHVHKHGLVHLDIKPDNIFLTEDGALKLGDFGIAIQANEHKELELDGSAPYLAPEILDKSIGDVGQACDLFSLGLILFEMAAHVNLPTCGQAYQQLRNEQAIEIPSRCSQELSSVIYAMLSRDPKERPTIEQLLNSNCCRKHVAEPHSLDWKHVRYPPKSCYTNPIEPLVLPPPLEVTPMSNHTDVFASSSNHTPSSSFSDKSVHSTPSPAATPRNLFDMFNDS